MKKATASKSRFVSRFSKNKVLVSGTVACAFAALVSFHSVQDSPDGGSPVGELNIASFENMPPLPRGFWIRKLPLPLSGEENVEMRIGYYADPAIAAFPAIMPIYIYDAGNPILFYDDGSHGDSTSGDLIYTSHIAENIPALVNGIQAKEAVLDGKLPFSIAKGHTAELVTSFPHFEVDVFNAGGSTPVSALLINPVDCEASILKQNSLFITDLSVVEDPARTFNVFTSTGNPVGAWTFGTLMKNAANTASTGISAKAFLKSWVAHWTADETVNGQIVGKRHQVIDHIIRPWLLKCNPNIENVVSGCTGGPVTLANWACKWDHSSITEADLLKWAPFKLTAIVNRQDLAGNTSYARNVSNAGETRFIFSLVNPITGKIPQHLSQPGTSSCNSCPPNTQVYPFVDWAGMNVILEYENVQTSRCAMQSFAQSWLDLSSYPLPTNGLPNTTLNAAIEAITNTVTQSGAISGNANGSALARIRTNERLLESTNTGMVIEVDWQNFDWEFRQFEINATSHTLQQTPLFNSPQSTLFSDYVANSTYNTGMSSLLNVEGVITGNGNIPTAWVMQNALRVAQGTHALPESTMVNGVLTPLLAGAGRVEGEFAHFAELGWSTATNVSNFRTLRQQYSLQTCQGCHNGETKTVFTHVLPRGYGESANYWATTPDYFTGGVENHTAPRHNIGVTQLPGGGTVQNLPLPSGTRTIPVVSSMITGRNYGGLIGTTNKWQDDYINASEDIKDDSLNGLFYVNDPFNSWAANGVSPTPNAIASSDKKSSFNDLEFRKGKLCARLNTNCVRPAITRDMTPFELSTVMLIVKTVSNISLPKGSH